MDIFVYFSSISRLIVHTLLLLFVCSLCQNTSSNVNSCMLEERLALLNFRQDLTDPSHRLSSWVGHHCCRWRGISCNNRTGRVAMINLRNTDPYSRSDVEWNYTEFDESRLGGKLNPSMLALKHLTYLDLSYNDFLGTRIPKFIGQLTGLRYLNLSSASFVGEIPPSIANLSNLNYLDLSSDNSPYDIGNLPYNNLDSKNLNWLSHLSSLKYLNLNGVDLRSTRVSWLHDVNMLPSLLELHLVSCLDQNLPDLTLQSVNFSSLSVLDLSQNNLTLSFPTWIFNLTSLEKLELYDTGLLKSQLPKFIGNLCKLKFLNLGFNNFEGDGILRGFIDDFSNCSYNRIKHLQHLDLSLNTLGGSIPESIGMLKHLQHLDLSFTSLGGSIPESIGMLKHLQHLDLRFNSLGGSIPESIGMLKHLQHLDLRSNSFWGSIPESIGNLSSLKTFLLSNNEMNGSIPESIGQLSQLVDLYLSGSLSFSLTANSWQGILTEAHFLNLRRLKSFKINTKQPMSLVLNMSHDWVPPFKLHAIYIENCRVGSSFTTWLQSQTQVVDVTLRNTGISDTIPNDWFMMISSKVQHLDLSYNQIRGKLPFQYRFPYLESIDLSHNHFEGKLQLSPMHAPLLRALYLSDNHLEGTIPASICDMDLSILSLSKNQFFGEFPREWSLWRNIEVVDVSYNNLSGNIPSSMGIPTSLIILKMNKNNFSGGVPFSLLNCSDLFHFDLGDNKLTGQLPSWIGSKLHHLQILQLRSNFLSGHISPQLCNLQELRILDLGHNNFSGTIPTCLNNLTSLVSGQGGYANIASYYDQATVISKGRELEYTELRDALMYVASIDLSSNNFEGEIPREICSLMELVNLNLSRNQLTGTIPSKIGNLTMLESLDLSHNHLSGNIPQSMSSLNFLSHLNLSHNHLGGRIPSGSQLQTLDDPSIYEGNPSLCGFPLSKCSGDEIPTEQPFPAEDDENHEDENRKLGFYVSAVLGFVVGFWGVCGTLILKRSWRYAYFQFFDNIKDKIALAIALKAARLQRRY